MGKIIKVGMADMNICSPPDIITTLGLGSCVGLVLYDVRTKLCGLMHIMLPDSTKIKNNSNRAKFADTAISDMLEIMKKNGSNIEDIIAKIAGGARMFEYGADKKSRGIISIGDENINAVIEILKCKNIQIISKDIGKNYGRTIIFDPSNGNMTIRAVGKAEKII